MYFDVVIIGGGPAGTAAGVRLLGAGLSCAVVSEGLSLGSGSKAEFLRLGGTFLPGDSVLGGEFSAQGSLLSVRTRNLEGTPLQARDFILATGRFFSKGLVSTMDRVYEPVFGCEVEFDPDRSKWCSQDFFAPQPFEDFGVITDECGRVSIGGTVVPNLYACGEVLRGRQDISQSVDRVCRSII